jgi:RNase P subunit RPR2
MIKQINAWKNEMVMCKEWKTEACKRSSELLIKKEERSRMTKKQVVGPEEATI